MFCFIFFFSPRCPFHPFFLSFIFSIILIVSVFLLKCIFPLVALGSHRFRYMMKRFFFFFISFEEVAYMSLMKVVKTWSVSRYKQRIPFACAMVIWVYRMSSEYKMQQLNKINDRSTVVFLVDSQNSHKLYCRLCVVFSSNAYGQIYLRKNKLHTVCWWGATWVFRI